MRQCPKCASSPFLGHIFKLFVLLPGQELPQHAVKRGTQWAIPVGKCSMCEGTGTLTPEREAQPSFQASMRNWQQRLQTWRDRTTTASPPAPTPTRSEIPF